jgi:hypothetical protein
MRITVFIQNEAGSNRKNYHDEKTLEYKETKRIRVGQFRSAKEAEAHVIAHQDPKA